MTQVTRPNVSIPIGPNNQLVNGNLLINDNGDAEWFQIGASNPTFTSNASNGYKWQPSPNCLDFLGSVTCPTEEQKKTFYNDPTSINTLNQSRYDTFVSSTGLGSPELAQQLNVPNPSTTIQTEATNFGIVDPNNELFNVTASDFQEDGAFKPENLIYPVASNSSQNRINITQRRYVAAIDSLGENNSIFDPRFNESATKEEFLGTVVLPMPNNISESNSTGWGENSLSTLAAQVMTGALKVVDNVGAGKILEGGQEAITAMKNLATQGESKEYIKQLLTLNAAASVTKFLGINIDPEAYRSRATGTVINPNLELLFNGPRLRSFGFEFKMIPRSEGEAKNIRYILKFFKKGMSAKRGSAGEGYFLGAPNVFDIEFKGSENTIGKIKTCALQSFNVNYTPDGVYAAFKDSQPISVVMQLAFTELTPIYNDDYNENTDSVGWDDKN